MYMCMCYGVGGLIVLVFCIGCKLMVMGVMESLLIVKCENNGGSFKERCIFCSCKRGNLTKGTIRQ